MLRNAAGWTSAHTVAAVHRAPIGAPDARVGGLPFCPAGPPGRPARLRRVSHPPITAMLPKSAEMRHLSGISHRVSALLRRNTRIATAAAQNGSRLLRAFLVAAPAGCVGFSPTHSRASAVPRIVLTPQYATAKVSAAIFGIVQYSPLPFCDRFVAVAACSGSNLLRLPSCYR